MKKKLLLTLAMVALLVCTLAICVSAAPRNYQSYEAELVSGEKITVYQAQDWDQWQGRIWVTNVMYTEAPVDSEGTYATVDWSQIKVLDFTNAWGHVYNSTTGEHELKRGTNGSMHVVKTNFTPANAVNLEKVISGAAKIIIGATFSSCPALKELVVDSSLVEIGYNGFEKCPAFTTVTFSGERNLKTIGQQAFIGCTALETVDFLGSVTSMGGSVFGGCTSLKTVEWPSAMTTIPNNTFDGCKALQFEIPSYITSIGSSAFKNCDAFVSVTIPDGVTKLDAYAFSSCDNLEEIIISDNSQISNRIVGMAEYCPKLTSIRIPPLVTDIGYDNFRGCTSLAEIIWPNNLLKISAGQNFSNIAMTTITIPNSVTYMDGSNFSNLEEIRFGASMTNLGGGNLASKSLKRVYIPGSITSIASNLLGYSNANDSSMNITFICTGTREEAEAIMAIAKAAAAGTGREPNMCKIYDAVLVSADEYDITQEPSGFTFVYGYSTCDAFYASEHAMTGNAVMQFRGYFNDVTYEDLCTRNGCGRAIVDNERTISAMFTWKGYSYSEFADANGAYSVAQCFEVDKDSIAKYAEATGDDFVYGVLATGNASGEAFDPQLGDEKVLYNQFNTLAHDYFVIKVSGITEAIMNAKIVFCAYVVDGDTMSYLDGGATLAEVTGVSYNELAE